MSRFDECEVSEAWLAMERSVEIRSTLLHWKRLPGAFGIQVKSCKSCNNTILKRIIAYFHERFSSYSCASVATRIEDTKSPEW